MTQNQNQIKFESKKKKRKSRSAARMLRNRRGRRAEDEASSSLLVLSIRSPARRRAGSTNNNTFSISHFRPHDMHFPHCIMYTRRPHRDPFAFTPPFFLSIRLGSRSQDITKHCGQGHQAVSLHPTDRGITLGSRIGCSVS